MLSYRTPLLLRISPPKAWKSLVSCKPWQSEQTARVLITSEDCFIVATFHIILHAMAGGTFIYNRHFASIPFPQIMDIRVAFFTVEVALRMMHTSQVFLCFLLVARAAIYLCRYVDSFRMLFKIYNIYMTAATCIGTMDRVCEFHPSRVFP